MARRRLVASGTTATLGRVVATDGATTREEQVYAAALRLFREKGYHGTSMQEIADAVGLYKGSLYHYIGGKEDLLARAFERAMGGLVAEVERIAADASLAPAEQLRQVIHAHVQAVAENLDALTVYLHEWRVLDGEALEAVRHQRERYATLLGGIVERGVKLGAFQRRVDAHVATLGILGMVNWLYQWYRPTGRLGSGEIAEHLSSLVLDGLTVRT